MVLLVHCTCFFLKPTISDGLGEELFVLTNHHPTENPQSEVVFQELSGLGLIPAVQNRVTHTWTSSANARLVCPSTPPLVLNDVKRKANRKQRWLQTALLSLPLYINLLYHRITVCQYLLKSKPYVQGMTNLFPYLHKEFLVCLLKLACKSQTESNHPRGCQSP